MDTPPEADERRAMPRAATERRALLTAGSGAMLQGHTVDVSPDGVRVALPIALAAGEWVELELPARPDRPGDAPVAVPGRVAWAAPGPATGTWHVGIRLFPKPPPSADATGLGPREAQALLAEVRELLRARAARGDSLVTLTRVRPPVHRRRWPWALLLLLLLLFLGSYTATRLLAGGPWRGPSASATLDAPEALDAAQEALVQGDTPDALRRFEQLAARGPTAAVRLIAALGHADALRLLGRAPEALLTVRGALNAEPDAPKAWRELAEAYRDQLMADPTAAAAPPLLANALELLPAATPQAVRAAASPPGEEAAPTPPPASARQLQGPLRIEVDASDYLLTLYVGSKAVAVYPVGLGEGSSTPRGDFTIANKIANPDWFNRGEVVKHGDPRNPLGASWMGLGTAQGPTSYGIHPTQEAGSIRANKSRGCVRMLPRHAAELFLRCDLGTPVHIRD